MEFIVDLARDLAVVAIELVVLITLGWCLSRNSARQVSSGVATASFAWANRKRLALIIGLSKNWAPSIHRQERIDGDSSQDGKRTY